MIWYILDQKENINLKGIAKKAKEKVTKKQDLSGNIHEIWNQKEGE